MIWKVIKIIKMNIIFNLVINIICTIKIQKLFYVNFVDVGVAMKKNFLKYQKLYFVCRYYSN